MNLTAKERLILQHVARAAAEDTDNRDGWCRWGGGENDPWRFEDYKPLVAAGLLERKETWKDVLLRPSPAGWSLLGLPSTYSLHADARGMVVAQNYDRAGDAPLSAHVVAGPMPAADALAEYNRLRSGEVPA